MLAMQPADADREAAALLRRLNFVSTYGFSKVLAEQLLNEPDCLPGVAKVIVRPSLISNTAYGPYPGYLGGFAGSPGYIMGARLR
jgi:nucleoside-diphosphate-sugar epimerase